MFLIIFSVEHHVRSFWAFSPPHLTGTPDTHGTPHVQGTPHAHMARLMLMAENAQLSYIQPCSASAMEKLTGSSKLKTHPLQKEIIIYI